MKRTIYFITSGILISILLLGISCSKEDIKSDDQNQTDKSNRGQQFTKAIKDFKQKVAHYQEKPAYKSGETVNADSALLLLEGTINYSHAFTMDYYDETRVEDLTLVLPKNGNGEVDMEVLVQKYLEMKADITTVYYNSNFENKGLVLVDLSETTQNGDEITINVGVITGDRNNQLPPGPGISGPFEEGDDWWYGENVGTCDGSITFSDAAHEISGEMAKYIHFYNLEHGIAYFWLLTTLDLQGGDDYIRRPGDPSPQDNFYDYYLFNADSIYGPNADDLLCLE
ncbi:MAG: hypothetical protein JW731_08475 [Bacteroidales bacterium]|nr:hypothetical protein [Bacteroidales bacterium]